MFTSILYKIKWRYKQYQKKKLNAFDAIIKQVKLNKEDYNQKIYSHEKANKIIAKHIQSGKPFLVSRLGSGELRCILNYLHFKQKNKSVIWHEQVLHEMYNFGGIFPQNSKSLIHFSNTYMEAIKSINSLGIWYNANENKIIDLYCPNANLIPLKSIEPYFHKDPWSQFLKGKRVLIIHPFEESIQKQYRIKEKLFEDKSVLPEFELITYKTPITIPGEPTRYKSWKETLYGMQHEIQSIDFDIAIIGAGPYGLPLGAFIKKMEKQAIHIGGATQILFGIKGKRWEDNPSFQNIINSYWIYPSVNETPQKYTLLEGACYWKRTNSHQNEQTR